MYPSSSYDQKVVASEYRPKESAIRKAMTTKPIRRIFAPTRFKPTRFNEITIWVVGIPPEYQGSGEYPMNATEATLLSRATSPRPSFRAQLKSPTEKARS